MKLTDWCILFSALFFCMMLPLDLKTTWISQSFCQQKKYERLLDTACENSLMDSVLREREDGSIEVKETQIYERFQELLELGFDAVSKEDRAYLAACVRLKEFLYLGKLLTPAQTDTIREQMEQELVSVGRYQKIRSDEKQFALFFPYVPREDWYQNIAGPSLYTLFEADDSKDTWKSYRRYVFSGGRIVKKPPEAGFSDVPDGFYLQKQP